MTADEPSVRDVHEGGQIAQEDVRRLRDEVRRLQGALTARADLEQALRTTAARLAASREDLAKIRSSTSFRLAQILASAARQPARAPIEVPRGLGELWRGRQRARAVRTQRSTTPTSTPAGDVHGPPANQMDRIVDVEPASLLTAFSTLMPRPRDRLVVAGILSEATREMANTAAYVTELQPGTAQWALEATKPDLLLVEASASRAGSWAGLGTYAALDRDADLRNLLAQAGGLGIPTVLTLDVPDTQVPALDAMRARFDVLLRSDRTTVDGGPWDRGVALSVAGPFGPTRHAADVVIPGDPEILDAALVATVLDLLDGVDPALLLPAGTSTAMSSARVIESPALAYWAATLRGVSCGVILPGAAPADVLSLAATGARLAFVGDAPVGLPHDVGLRCRPEGLVDAVHAALGEGRRPTADLRGLLREIDRHHSTRKRLGTLAAAVGLDDTANRMDVAVLIAPAADSDPETIATGILHQDLRPTEVVVADSGDTAHRLVERLTRFGLTARLRLVPTESAPWVALAAGATAELLAPSVGPWLDPHRLRDLVVAADVCQADVVGIGTDCYRAVETLPFPALARRSLVMTWGDVAGCSTGVWTRNGHRLVSLPLDDSAELEGIGA
jgi:hypothetical protein